MWPVTGSINCPMWCLGEQSKSLLVPFTWCVCTCLCLHVCWPKVDFEYLPLLCSHNILRQDLLLNPELFWLACLAAGCSTTWSSTSVFLPLAVQSQPHSVTPVFYMGALALNPCPHACEPKTLLREWSPQLHLWGTSFCKSSTAATAHSQKCYFECLQWKGDLEILDFSFRE